MNRDALLTKVAEGFYDNGLENNLLTLYRENLKFFVWNLKKNPEYFDFLKSPFVDYKDKCKSLDNIFGDVLVNEVLVFIKLLISKNYIEYIETIQTTFNKLEAKHSNIISGTLYTPFHLTHEQIGKIEDAFSVKTGHVVELKEVIDKSLIAGVKVLLDDTLYEYTVSSKLDEIKDRLLSRIDNKEEK